MTNVNQLKRDSPPNSVKGFDYGGPRSVANKSELYSYETEESSQEEKANVEIKKDAIGPVLSSKLELDAGLESMFKATHEAIPTNYLSGKQNDEQQHGREELELVKHLTEPLDVTRFKHTDDAGFKCKGKKKRHKKRGSSLEREIAKLILQTAPPEQLEDFASLQMQTKKIDNVTTNDILTDLIRPCDGTASLSSQSIDTSWMTSYRNITVPKISSSEHFVAKKELDYMSSEVKNLPHEDDLASSKDRDDLFSESKSNGFFFQNGDDWTAFDDCPPFETSFFPAQLLDKNGFPIVEDHLSHTVNGTDQTSSHPKIDIIDDDSEAEEEQLAAELAREMADEVAREALVDGEKTHKVEIENKFDDFSKRSKQSTNLFMSSKEISPESIIPKEEREESNRPKVLTNYHDMEDNISDRERREQEMAKELARKIAKEKEWGKLQQMALELSQKKLGEQKNDEGKKDRHQFTEGEDDRESPIFDFEPNELEAARRGYLCDDEVSSLPTTQSRDSKSQSPVQSEVDRRGGENCSCMDSPESTSNSKKGEPKSPSSVTDITHKAIGFKRSSSKLQQRRYHHGRIFANQISDTSTKTSTRPKPTWDPKPPKHYNRGVATSRL